MGILAMSAARRRHLMHIGLAGAPVASLLVLTPEELSVAIGRSRQLEARVYDQRGALMVGATVVYSSSDESVATVSASGVVTGRGAGEAVITASSSGARDTTAITVTASAYPYAGLSSATVYTPNYSDLELTLPASHLPALPEHWMQTDFPDHPDGVVWDINELTGSTPAAKFTTMWNMIAAGTIMGCDIVELDPGSEFDGNGVQITYTASQQWDIADRPLDDDGMVTTRDTTTTDPAEKYRYITIRSKRHDELPVGVRVQPVADSRVVLTPSGTYVGQQTPGPDAGKFAIVRSNGAAAVIRTKRYSTTVNGEPVGLRRDHSRQSYYRFVGLEIRNGTGGGTNKRMVCFGNNAGDEAPPELNQLAHHLILDRSYVYVARGQSQATTAVGLHCQWGALVDSVVILYGAIDKESHAIEFYCGNGPFKVVNNTFNSACICVMSGGAEAGVRNEDGTIRYTIIPSDVEFRNNLLVKDASLNRNDLSNAGSKTIAVKNLFELKQGVRWLVEGNRFRQSWPDWQNGAALLLKITNQSGGFGSWVTTQDITIRFNHFTHIDSFCAIVPRDGDGAIGEPMSRICLDNNLVQYVSWPWSNFYTGSKYSQTSEALFYLTAEFDPANWMQGLTIEQNTFLDVAEQGFYLYADYASWNPATMDSFPLARIRKNIIQYGAASWNGSSTRGGGFYCIKPSTDFQGHAAAQYVFPSGDFLDNLWIDVPSADSALLTSSLYTKLARADLQLDEELNVGNPLYVGYGCDMPALRAYTATADDPNVAYPTPKPGMEYPA